MVIRDQGRHADSEDLFVQALAIFEAALPAGHNHLDQTTRALAALYLDPLSRPADALTQARAGSANVLVRVERLRADAATRDLAQDEVRGAQSGFILHALAARRAAVAGEAR